MEEFESAIKLTDRFFVVPNEIAKERFDLWEIKKTEKFPEGKPDNVGYGMNLPHIIENVCYMETNHINGIKDLQRFVGELKQFREEIKKNIVDYLS